MVIVVAFKATAETLVGGEGAEMSKVITLLFNSLKKKKKRIESTLTIGVKKPKTLFLHEILLLYKDKISTMT